MPMFTFKALRPKQLVSFKNMRVCNQKYKANMHRIQTQERQNSRKLIVATYTVQRKEPKP